MNWEAVRNFFRSRYVLWLESEVERLRDENRSMLNSLLVKAGVNPVDLPKPIPRGGRRMSRHQFQAQLERDYYATPGKPEAS